MKKVIYAALCLFLLCGCHMNTHEDTHSNAKQEITKSNEQQSYTEMNPAWYQSFETGLKEGNIEYGSKLSLDPSVVQAKEGYRYRINDKDVDVYYFDNQEVLDQLKKNQTVEIDGQKRSVYINGRMAIIGHDLSQDIMDIFNNIKEEI